MSASHTPGRALLDKDEPIVRGGDGERIANCYRFFDGDPAKTPEKTGMANARRVWACWNACEMVSTEDLEALTRPGDVSWACTIDRVVRQRDELAGLLAEVSQVFTRDDDLPGDLLSRIDSAMDPAKGSAA